MIHVGLHEQAISLREFPETAEGYEDAVEFIGTLNNHDEGIYYLDAPESLLDSIERELVSNPDLA